MTLHSNPTDAESNTLRSALDLLQSLKPKIMEILAGKPLLVPFHRMGIMNPRYGDLSKAHVLWLGPAVVDEDARRLTAVCSVYFHCGSILHS